MFGITQQIQCKFQQQNFTLNINSYVIQIIRLWFTKPFTTNTILLTLKKTTQIVQGSHDAKKKTKTKHKTTIETTILSVLDLAKHYTKFSSTMTQATTWQIKRCKYHHQMFQQTQNEIKLTISPCISICPIYPDLLSRPILHIILWHSKQILFLCLLTCGLHSFKSVKKHIHQMKLLLLKKLNQNLYSTNKMKLTEIVSVKNKWNHPLNHHHQQICKIRWSQSNLFTW